MPTSANPTGAKRLAAKPVKEKILARVKERVNSFQKAYGRAPQLCVVLVGEDPASQIYTQKKGEAAISVGMKHESIVFPKTASATEVSEKIQQLNEDPNVDGILVQRPLPYPENEVVYWVDEAKDVDAFHPTNTGKLRLGLPCFQPCTPAGVMEMLHHYQIPLEGALACVVGRSSIVGNPMATLLQQANATVIQCHSRTKNLAELTRQADILVAAAGKPKLINDSHVRPGTAVIDIGIHRQKNGKLCGDVDADSVSPVASGLTPVPGGVGPMTIAMLLENTVEGAFRRLK